ncbi:MAG: SpoIVB peptidase [Clostridia bacterium]|nr:SpoIVB peptidase [Clostridia bacterium]
MPPRRNRNKVILFLSLLALLGACCYILQQVLEVNRLPTDLRLAPGEEFHLTLRQPFRFYLPAKRPDGIIGFNGAEVLEKGISGYCSAVTVRPEKEGVSFLDLRFFGVTIRRVNLEFVKMPRVVPGGHAIGVLSAEEGVMVVGYFPVRDEEGRESWPAREAGLRIGDLIVAIDDHPLRRIEEMDFLLQHLAAKGRPLTLTIMRDGARRKIPVLPVKRQQEGMAGEKPLYLLGLYVEDPAAGVGTLTYFQPETGHFGGLGHRVIGFGNRPLPLGQGKIVAARITGINQGNRGEPGEKIGIFSGREDVIGEIRANTELGIFGILTRELKNPYYPLAIPVATAFEVTTGPAEIMTVISGREIRRFTIEIQRVYRQKTLRDKGLVIRVTDPVLLAEAGGIVQGMSGSPIIQNGKMVGAVTHVFVNDPTRGYGVFAEWMLQMEETVWTEEKKVS